MPGSQFDWQIGDDKWGDLPREVERQIDLPILENAPTGEDDVRPRRWHWRAALMVGLILGLIGAVASLLIAQRVAEVTAPIQKDVLSSHELMQVAISQSDAELFTSLLSRGDSSWRTAVQELFHHGSLFDRGPLGLRAQASVPQIVDVILSPDLKEAEVTVEQAYTAGVGNGVTETVRLRQAAVYRFDHQRWLLAAPTNDFWGGMFIHKGEFLTLDYPERDEAIGSRLFHDLDALLGKMCNGSAGVNCPNGFHLRLELARGLSYLVDMFEQDRMIRSGFIQPPDPSAGDSRDIQGIRMLLPAPTLVGVPVDEAGYQALYRGYARQVVQVAMSKIIGPLQNWQTQQVAQSETDKQLIQLGLRSWPVATATKQSSNSILYPNQDVYVYCVEGVTRGGSLVRYLPSTDTWSTELSGRWFVSMNPLPGGDGLIVEELPVLADAKSSRLILWRDGQERVLFDDPLNASRVFFGGQGDPSGRNLLIGLFTDASYPTPALLDTNSCVPAGCNVNTLSGWPTWSPDGSRTIMTYLWQRYTAFRGDGAGQSRANIGAGHSPFWLDNETYGYLRRAPTQDASLPPALPGFEAAMAAVTNDEAQALLRPEDLRAALPDGEQLDQMGIIHVLVNPSDSNLLLIQAYATQQSGTTGFPRPDRTYLFLFNRRSGDVSLRFQFKHVWPGFNFSPDGRWLVASAFDFAGSVWSLHVHDVDRNETKTFTFHHPYAVYSYASPKYDWSADGQWLLTVNDGVLHLIAPAYDYHQTVVPESPGCVFAAWVNRE